MRKKLRKDSEFRLIYAAYMRSEKWQNKRARRLAKDLHTCQMCGQIGSDKQNPLHVHHFTYENLGSEKMRDLITYCKKCHELWHRNNTTGRWIKKKPAPKKTNKRKLNKPKPKKNMYRKK